MQTERFSVANVKCGGCAANIRKGLGELPGVQAVEVDVAAGRVTVSGASLARDRIAAKLGEIGYPEKK
jgi:copper chaperone